jgi:hypothetical protein
MIFRLIFPGSQAPLEIYSFNWRIIQGVLDIFNLFPALVFSALVIPFGFASYEETFQSFSDIFFKRLFGSVVTAICGAVIYCIIFFLALPMVKSYEENLRFSGNIYSLAKSRAFEMRDAGSWHEAVQFLNICNRIWLNSPELAALRDEVAIHLENYRYSEIDGRTGRFSSGSDRRGIEYMENIEGLNPTIAITMGTAAFNEERYFDAHWLALLARRLAARNSPEAARAAQLASNAWNMISSQAPSRSDERLTNIFNLKLSGYRAMEANNWIQAYYIFRQLQILTPNDPDVINFLAISERGAVETAFFLDEMEISMGEILSGALFSLPCGTGRAVVRLASLTTTDDIAFGTGFEYMRVDANNIPQVSVTARYVKLVPNLLDGRPRVQVITHALDRYDESRYYRGEWLVGSETPDGILLEISFEDFLLIANVRRGLTNLQITELFTASQRLDSAGYVYQIFQAEILNRLGSAMFFLPMAMFVIIFAWRYRAKTRPRYFFVLLLPVLPVVFHGFVFLYRAIFNSLGIWLVLSIGFTASLVVYIVTLALSLFVSLIALSAQHS